MFHHGCLVRAGIAPAVPQRNISASRGRQLKRAMPIAPKDPKHQ
jgi:hypothetical protein